MDEAFNAAVAVTASVLICIGGATVVAAIALVSLYLKGYRVEVETETEDDRDAGPPPTN